MRNHINTKIKPCTYYIQECYSVFEKNKILYWTQNKNKKKDKSNSTVQSVPRKMKNGHLIPNNLLINLLFPLFIYSHQLVLHLLDIGTGIWSREYVERFKESNFILFFFFFMWNFWNLFIHSLLHFIGVRKIFVLKKVA